MDNNKFTHCLRAQIYPDRFSDERIKSILEFATKYGFKNVILMFNAEEFNTGHATIEELKPWMEVILKAKNIFAKHGITTSLNPWIEFGHLDRGRKLKKGQHFMTMVDKNGKKAKMVVCPLDKEWRKFYLDKLSYYVSTIKPEVLWIEDDFRLHNHDPLEWGGCFCDNHIALINKKLKSHLTRKEIIKGIVKDTNIRKAWLDSSWETLDSLAKLIASTVKKTSPHTSVALMSSAPQSHQMEGRRWETLLGDLSTDGKLIDRIHLPCYDEIAPRKYLYHFNGNSMVVRAFIKDKAYIYPELENSVFSSFAKSPKFLSFQVESSLPLGIKGMTYDIFEFVGNGVQNEFKYGEALCKISPYLDAIKKLDLKPSEMTGLVFPIDEMSVLNRHASNWDELAPNEHNGISIFSSLGFSFKLSENKKFHNEVVVLTGQTVNNFTNKQLISLFKDNLVVLDGETAINLIDRKLGYLVNASSYKEFTVNTGAFSFEMLTSAYKGMHNYRASLEKVAGNYVCLKYNRDVNVYSNVYDYNHKIVGPGIVKSNNFIVIPYIYNSMDYSMFTVLKDYLFTTLIKGNKPLIKSINQGIYPYLYKKRDHYILFLTNAYNDINEITLFAYNLDIHRITLITEKGEHKKVKFTCRNNKLVIKNAFPYLSTQALVID